MINFGPAETYEVASLIFNELKNVPENNVCFDWGKQYIPTIYSIIGAENPQWASVSNAVFLCLNCAGTHRTLGAHYSSVRSLRLDSWNEKQLKCMSVGGNKKFREFMSQYDLDQETIDYKYKTQAAEFYRKKVNLICFLIFSIFTNF